MRAEATWFLDQHQLLGLNSVRLFIEDFRGFLEQMMPLVEQGAGRRPEEDVPGRVALAAVGAARRRLDEPEAAELDGEVARAMRLAHSAVALCDHYDALSGRLMCLVCDHMIEAGEASVPYARFRSDPDAADATHGPGSVHARCTGTLRRR
ncbi:DUF6415 family natural product biosynthesis protein [Streptomyces sp. NPDC052773]|uniref:DUF6415 family natural product biosynthesis protein n=1 Tax=Streptomyces sp. NPDC052773 TaxID=3365693 RepID=UPI0037D282B3